MYKHPRETTDIRGWEGSGPVGLRTGVLAVMDGYRVTGPARQLLAAALTRQGSDTTTMLALFQRSAKSTPLVEAARRSNAPVHVVRDRFPGDPRTAIELAALLRRPEMHILQTHGYKANVLGRLVATALRRPWVAFLHGETWENRKVRAYFALERTAVRRADCIVVVSHDMARMVVGHGIPSAKVQVVHNACLVAPDGNAPAWSAELPPLVGVIGRLSPEKGVDLALRVHCIVARRFPNAQLLVVGEGPERGELQNHAERLGVGPSVLWLGYQEELADVYRRLAVLLIPSRSEGLPNVALEAMGHGVPVIATSVGGLPEVVSDGENGFLAPSGDAEVLAQRVLCILEDPLLRRRLGQRARQDMASRFSFEARLQALDDIYRGVRS
jgi:glycosyltransferase involved in cell wall biosynthesis